MLHKIFFSCAGTTRMIANKIAQGLDSEIAVCDLLSKDFNGLAITNQNDVAVIAVPVWGGRVPALAVEKLRRVIGNGQRVIAVVVYGNRDYDDALLELCDIATEQGFKVISAAAFVAEHCIFPTVAADRPDMSDDTAISLFVQKTKESIISDSLLDMKKVKGNRPYKKAAGVPLRPKTHKDSCHQCSVCVNNCPTGAIDATTFATDPDKCISCCRCIAMCNNDARKFGGIMYATVNLAFKKMCAKRREPEWFV